MLHFHQIIFFTAGNEKNNAYKLLRALGFLTLHAGHQMLHQCNIFKGISQKKYRYIGQQKSNQADDAPEK